MSYGFSLLKDLDKYYSNASIGVKQKLIGSIFPEKLIYQDEKYRTSQINEVLSLITNNINHLGGVEKEKAIKIDSSSYQAPAVGLEPTSRPVWITATRSILISN